MNKHISRLTMVLLCVLPWSLFAQQDNQETFGRNRIQYEQFDWRYLSSENFDIYFYRGNDKIAKDVLQYIEGEFDRITDLIGYPPYTKTKIFLYNSNSDLQQSNVGIDQAGMSPGGETQFIKPYIEIAHPGSIDELKQELIDKVSALMVNEMMFGGSLKDMFQSSVLLNLPEWFISGAARYVANGWSIEMDDYIRDYINSKRPEKLSRLTGEEAALAGQSVWNYIAEQYGRSNISNILNYTRIIRNEEKSVAITLGVPFEQVLFNWRSYYLNIDQRVDEKYKSIGDEFRITQGKNKRAIKYQHVVINNTGSKVAYSANDEGRYKVIIKDLNTDNSRTALKGGYKVISQEIDYNLPLIDWVDSATLGIIHTRHGKLLFELYDYNTNSKLIRRLDKFESVQNFSFSDNGRLMIVSAVVNGQNDLYLMSTRRDRIKRLNDDPFDDIDPSFVPNTNSIVFASNRTTDTLNVKVDEFEQLPDNHNLFFYNLDTTKNVLKRVTNTISKDTKPIAYDANTIYYLSDQKGIINLFKFNIAESIYSQVTNYKSSLQDYDIDFYDNQLAFSAKDHALTYVYSIENFDFNQQIFTPTTPRKQVIQAREFKARRNKEINKGLTIQDIVESRLKEKEEELEQEKRDTSNLAIDTVGTEVPVDTVMISDSLGLMTDSVENVQDTTQVDNEDIINTEDYSFEDETNQEEVINTDDYTFETDVIKDQNEPGDSFLSQYRKLRQKNSITGPYPYEPRFSAKNLVTSFVIDPLRGFGVLLHTEMYDMLENHKFEGGVMATTDLRSGDIFAQYYYLKTRIDYTARFERNVILRETDFSLRKYSKNMIMVGAALPFNNKSRIEVNPFVAITQNEILNPVGNNSAGPVFAESVTSKYVGAKSALVYDNSIVNGMNLIEGSRGKIEFTHYEGMDDKDRSFSKVTVDLRHYQKIHREIVLAGRLYYGSFFGRSPKQFLLGGSDNWLFKKENTEGNNNPLNQNRERNNDDLLFIDYATNLRGFDYASIVGHNVLLFNAELRVPLIRYLASGPISSNFFRNLQFTGFFDIGSAWSGKSPFNTNNSISTETISEGSFVINIKKYQNPWLYSYGAGVRSMVLGYYLKLDVAWPVEDYTVNDPRVMLTLGYDF